MATGFTIRNMACSEVSLIRDWAAAEGWNPGLHDIPCFYDADPAGFLLGTLDDEPIGCISCVNYGDAFGFLGQYIVRPEYRGLGYGLQIWQAGMKLFGDRNVGLDGVEAQQGNYRRSGFKFAYNHIRYRGLGGGAAAPDAVPLEGIPFEDIAAYDRQHFPAPRDGFLRNWIARPGCVALGCVKGKSLAGYGVMRPAIEGFKIGPLFADDLETGDVILTSLLAHAAGQPAVFDAPDDSANPLAGELARRHGWVEVFRTARMYTQSTPRLPMTQIFGVTSLELG